MNKVVSLGCDHAGFEYKEHIKRILDKLKWEYVDHGTSSADSVDYPDFVHPVAEDVKNGKVRFGILICGSGNGVAMTANKHQQIRAALCWNTKLAELAREHNNANVIAIPARFVSKRMASSMVRSFLESDFEGGRHARRVDKIAMC